MQQIRRKGTPQDNLNRFYELFGDVLELANDHQNPALRPEIRRLVLSFQNWEKHYLTKYYQGVKRAFRQVEQNSGIHGAPYDLNQIFVAMKATAVPLAELRGQAEARAAEIMRNTRNKSN